MTLQPARRFGAYSGRVPGAGDRAFLAALYLACRPDLGALPVPRSVIEGIARHQQGQRDTGYAARYPQAQAWLVEEAGRPLAWMLLAQSGNGLRVVDLAVDPAQRRTGVARAVLLALQGEQAAIALRVRAGNAPARALYAGLGFVVTEDQSEMLELSWTRTR